MEKYSCSYANTKSNFVFQNIEEMADKKYDLLYDKFYGVYCVIQNIIQRGTPTKPSEVLESTLGKIDTNVIIKIPLIKDNTPIWIDTIKGDELSSDFPAKIFYDDIYPRYMKEYAFTRQLILPEAKLTDILSASKIEFLEQQVDFYLPGAKLVIEVDGGSHSDNKQFNKDKIRDDALNKEGIKVIRIPSYDIKNNTIKLISIMETLYTYVKSCDGIQEYKASLENSENYDLHIKYDSVIRFQILILSCLKHGIFKAIDKEWQINILESDYDDIINLVYLAYNDLKQWVTIITKLLKISYNVPKLKVISGYDAQGINVDFSIYNRWTDNYKYNNNCIFIRNDYYDNKNYFKMATSDSMQYKFSLEEPNSDVLELKYILRNLFGYEEFRDGQLPIIINVLERNDTIGILPTGTGKSLCYQFAAILQPGVSIVVAPIISLMVDQKGNMDEVGMTRTAYVASNLTAIEKEFAIDQFIDGQYELVWISPERFQSEKFRSSLKELNEKRNFALAIIDEVHCLSEWGHDFRTSYLTLTRTLKEFCPEACLLGLTATASQAVLEDLKNEFEVDGSSIKALGSMDRRELVFLRKEIKPGNRKIDVLKDVFLELEQYYGVNVLDTSGNEAKCGLVFTPTKGGINGCIKFAYEFSHNYKKKIGIYHGGLSSEERANIQNYFISNKLNILTCTKAFGMGINKKNINYTIHYGIPQSIESFYQEAGRAGRSENKEKKSFCYILYQSEGCSKDVIDNIFSLSTTVDERKELCKFNLHNDLSTLMFLWNINRYNVDEEYNIIRVVLKMLYQGIFIIPFDGDSDKANTELALYKLSILGIVKDWTIGYSTLYKGNIDVIYNECDEENIKDRLLKYIRKYDVEFRLDNPNGRYKKYVELSDDSEKPITKYIKILLTWSNDNILYQRLQSTYNMLQLCDTKVSDEDFRRRLDYYFRYSEITIELENIAYHPKEYKSWFEIFYDRDEETIVDKDIHIITKEKADNILASLQRYLESYQNNTGLNFLYGILCLFTNQYDQNKGQERLKDAFENIKGMETAEIDDIINRTLIIGKEMDESSKVSLSKIINANFSDKSRKIFNQLEDDYSLCIELEKSLTKLNNIKEEYTWDR